MDVGHFLDLASAAALAVIGFIAKTFHMRITVTEEKISLLHEIFVKRSDYKDTMDRVFASLERIEDKLDSKADR